MRIAFTHNLQTDHDDEGQAEFDRPETVDAIASGLERLGHEVVPIDVSGPVSRLVARLEGLKPDLVFNTAEGAHGRFREAFWPALFEQLALPYTGSDAWVCAVTLDKQLSKILVAQAGVPTPRWIFVDDLSSFELPDLRFPVIVKPNFEGSSKGITQDSIVERKEDLHQRVASILAKYPSGLLIEEFIVGRDVVVPFLEAAAPASHGVLTAASYRFDEGIVGKRKYAIYDYELKCVSSDAVQVEVPAPLPPSVAAEIEKQSLRVFRALGVRDLGRIDWRVDDGGQVTFLEVNALPSLEPGAGIYLSAALAGLTRTEDVLGAVVQSACKRQGLPKRSAPGQAKRRTRVGLTYNLKRIQAKGAADDDSHAEYDSDTTIAALCSAIEQHGHEVVRLEATTDLVQTLPAAQVDVVFNLAEGQHGRTREAQVPALLELLGIPFSGSDAATMALALDKHLAKSVVRDAGVSTPRALLLTGNEDIADLRFPLIAKPNAEGSSKGVVPKSVVEDEAALRRIVSAMTARYRQPILVEEFLPGREFTVAVLGAGADGRTAEILPPMEIVYLDGAGPLPIYAFEDKLDWSKSIRYDRPAMVDGTLLREIEQVTATVWRALGCRDVARVDVRLDAHGRVCFIECNPLPGITPGWSDLCLIAESAGIDYAALIGRILAPALFRAQLVDR